MRNLSAQSQPCASKGRALILACVSTLALAGCFGKDDKPAATAQTGANVQPSQTAGAGGLECPGSKSDTKQAFFGDMHIHTKLSFDAYFFSSINGPREAYKFAKGADTFLPGSSDPDVPIRKINIGRPLDFAAVTEHAEQLGTFARLCELQGNVPAGTNPACSALGQFVRDNVTVFVSGDVPLYLQLVTTAGSRAPSTATWEEIQSITNAENQPCKFTTFNGYEFSSNKGGQVLHRNVIFATSKVPRDVVSSVPPFPTTDNTNDEWGLFDSLKTNCLDVAGCDVVTIPHNMNQSEGRFARPREASTGLPLARNNQTMTKADAQLRNSLDRVLEMIQHKGNSECITGFNAGLLAGEESGCGFEEWKTLCNGQPTDPAECARVCKGLATDPLFCQINRYSGSKPTLHNSKACTSTAPGASTPGDCTAPLDYARNVIPEGMALARKLGVNPYQYGFLAASDTHNGVAGNVDKNRWVKTPGHGGVLDNDPPEILGRWNCRQADLPTDSATGFKPATGPNDPNDPANCSDRNFAPVASNFTPGGLAGVWARENTRKEIFAAIKRRETFATSGSRMRIRTLASNKPFPADICERLGRGESPIEQGIVDGVPMGGTLPAPTSGKGPYVVAYAMQDPGDKEPGIPLQRLELVKTWADSSDQIRQKLVTLKENKSAPFPSKTCTLQYSGPEQLCAVYQDPDFNPNQGASYYARALENTSCRWTTRICTDKGVQCNQLQASNGTFPANSPFAGYEGCCRLNGEPGSFTGEFRFITQQERAWSSPIWVDPVRTPVQATR